VNIYVDGGTRNSNICMVNGTTIITKQRKNNSTNNELEYYAVLYALGHIRDKYKNEKVIIFSDSKLIVNQLNGKWRVTTPCLIKLNEKCTVMMTHKIKIKWISRKFNRAGWVLEKKNPF